MRTEIDSSRLASPQAVPESSRHRALVMDPMNDMVARLTSRILKTVRERGLWEGYESPDITPPGGAPFLLRLLWAASSNSEREATTESAADERRVKSTDLIRSRLLPAYHRHGISVYDQIRLVHNTHIVPN